VLICMEGQEETGVNLFVGETSASDGCEQTPSVAYKWSRCKVNTSKAEHGSIRFG
jgi:hypothetical protein